MRTLILLIIIAGSLAAIYWYMVRPMLRSLPSLEEAWNKIDEHERTLGKLVWARIEGWKTILWSRFLTVTGALSAVLAGVLPEITALVGVVDLDQFLPPKWVAIAGVGLIVIGQVNEYLRKVTTGPVQMTPAEPVKIEPEAPLPETTAAARPEG